MRGATVAPALIVVVITTAMLQNMFVCPHPLMIIPGAGEGFTESINRLANSSFYELIVYFFISRGTFSIFCLVQLIEQPILRIPNFNFPNLRCCKVFLFFVCKELYWHFLMYFGLNLKLLSCQYLLTK